MDHIVALAKGSTTRVAILYRDAKGEASSRVIQPKSVSGNFIDDRLNVHTIVAHCELANARRKFRLDRILILNNIASSAELDLARWVLGLELNQRSLAKAREAEHAYRSASVADVPPQNASDAAAFDEDAFLADPVRDGSASPAAIAEIRKAFARNKLAEASKEVRRTQKTLDEAVRKQMKALPDATPLPAMAMDENGVSVLRLTLRVPRAIHFRYRDEDGAKTERVVTPRQLVGTATSYKTHGTQVTSQVNLTELHGYCHLLKMPKRFLMVNIENVTDTNTGEVLDDARFQEVLQAMLPEPDAEAWIDLVRHYQPTRAGEAAAAKSGFWYWLGRVASRRAKR